jgi:hypothetical protein
MVVAGQHMLHVVVGQFLGFGWEPVAHTCVKCSIVAQADGAEGPCFSLLSCGEMNAADILS